MRDVALSVMEDADIPACLSLYRANEDSHFPSGFFARYEAQLRNGQFLNLVARRNGERVGCGGLMRDANGVACLCFGMVAPSHQRRGIGTALFLARLALLTPVDGWTTIRMSAVPNSIGFYRRFGVLFTQQRANGFLHAAGILDVRAAEIDACRNALADRHVSYPDVSDKIPRVGPTG